MHRLFFHGREYQFMSIFQKIVTPQNFLFLLTCAKETIIIAFFSLIFGTILGVLSAAAKMSKSKMLRAISTVYVEVFRGTPMMLQITLFYLAGPVLTKALFGFSFTPSARIVGIIAMSINSGAYTTELFRGAIQSIDKGQWEASKALGLSYKQMMRFVILPQSFKRILPPWISEFITLLKDTSLLASIGAFELMKGANVLGGRYYNFLIPLFMAAGIYLIMTLTISFFANKLEKRLAESD